MYSLYVYLMLNAVVNPLDDSSLFLSTSVDSKVKVAMMHVQ